MLAVRANLPSDGYFTVGMFSALDILMKSPIGHILAKLPLSDEVKSAILEHQGIQGEALSCALAVEKAEWKNFHEVRGKYGSASNLVKKIVIFNIRGNRYRLETKISYQYQIVLIKRIGTHFEYDRWYK